MRFLVWVGGSGFLVWVEGSEFHMQTLIIYKLGFNQNYSTSTLTLLIVLYSKFPLTKFKDYECFEMRFLVWVEGSGFLV
jgi:hypothetical protein